MSVGQELAESVRFLLTEHGTSTTFRRVTEGAYNESTGTTGASSTDDETVRAAFLRYRASEIDGTNIQRGDRRAILAPFQTDGSALSKTPQTDDQLVGEADTVSVVEARKLKSGDTIIGYELQVRE